MTTNKNPVKTKSTRHFFLILLFGLGVFANGPARAQVSFSVNISSQPVWGPVGYDYVEYYYLPAYDVYYYVPTGVFYYPMGARWVSSTYLPATYNVDLYNTYKVVINEPRPYLRDRTYAARYAHFKTSPPRQAIIKNSNDSKYFVVKGHPRNNATIVKTSNTRPAARTKTYYPADKTKTTPAKETITPKKYEETGPAKNENRSTPVRRQHVNESSNPQPTHMQRQNNNAMPRNQGHGNRGNGGGGGRHK